MYALVTRKYAAMEETEMNETKRQHDWTPMLRFYTEQNRGRPTRLGVFDGGNDYWLENGLPFDGIDVDLHGGSQIIEIVLGDFTHITKNVRGLKFVLSRSGDEDGVDIEDDEGKVTVLRFEAAA